MNKVNSLNKISSLKSKKDITHLFKNKIGFVIYPIKVMYVQIPNKSNSIKLIFSVSKKKFKKAVDRNKIKRHMREAYRTNQTILNTNINNMGLAIYIGYIGKNTIPYYCIEDKIKKSLIRLLDNIKK